MNWTSCTLGLCGLMSLLAVDSLQLLGKAVPANDRISNSEIDPTVLHEQARRVMDTYCVACHGPEKQKGKLQLIPLAKAFPADRRDRWSIIPGDPEASTVIQRVTLPPDHYDIMPPKGDVLTGEQVDLLRRWIPKQLAG